jgi:hypothetical protein
VSAESRSGNQAKLNNIRLLDGFTSVYTSPAEMQMPERDSLYSLIFWDAAAELLGDRYFSRWLVGNHLRGMNDTGFGQLECVEPMPKIEAKLRLK